jgi:hypothetical protein
MISAAASASAFSLRSKSFVNRLIYLRSFLLCSRYSRLSFRASHWPAGTLRANQQPARQTTLLRGSTRQAPLGSDVPFPAPPELVGRRQLHSIFPLSQHWHSLRFQISSPSIECLLRDPILLRQFRHRLVLRRHHTSQNGFLAFFRIPIHCMPLLRPGMIKLIQVTRHLS